MHPALEPSPAYRGLRTGTYELFTPNRGGSVGYWIDWFIVGLIAVNVTGVVLETVDGLAASYGPYFYAIELVSVAVFTVEYLGRVWSCVESPSYDGPVTGRLEFASRPLLVVDLLAIVPFYLGALFTVDLRFLRALRLLRFLRLLKLARYSEAMQSFALVVERKKEKLLLAFFTNGVLLVVASSVMYFLEHEAQPAAFSSIPAAFWWGVVTLTTVGYGDVHPVTPLGRVFGSVVAVLGIGMFALPASILASGFMEEADDVTECPHCGREIEH